VVDSQTKVIPAGREVKLIFTTGRDGFAENPKAGEE